MNVRIYDNGGRTFDRFTAVFMDWREPSGLYGAVGMSEHPCRPQGFGQWTAAEPGRHLGRRIRLSELPPDCRALVLDYLREMEAA